MEKFLYKVNITYTAKKTFPVLNGEFKEPKTEIYNIEKHILFNKLINTEELILSDDFVKRTHNVLNMQFDTIKAISFINVQELEYAEKETLTKELYSYLSFFFKGVNLLYEISPSKKNIYKFCIDITPFSNNDIEIYKYIFATIDAFKGNKLKQLGFLRSLYNDILNVLSHESIVRYDELNIKSGGLDPFYDIALESLDKEMLIIKVMFLIKKMVHNLRYSIFQVISSNCDFFKDIQHNSFRIYLQEYLKNLTYKESIIKLEKGIEPLETPEGLINEKEPLKKLYNKEYLKGLYKFSPKNNDYLYDYLAELEEKFSLSNPKKCYQNVFSAIALIIYESGVIVKGVTYISFLEALCRYFDRVVPKEVKPSKYKDKASELKSKHFILDNIPLK